MSQQRADCACVSTFEARIIAINFHERYTFFVSLHLEFEGRRTQEKKNK